MANTFTQIHIHAIFAVRFRNACISSSWKEELHKYITGIVRNHEHKVLAINSMPDHMHLLVGLRPVQSLSALMQDVKTGSSKWINDRGFCCGKFRWQEGFGGFSVGKRDVYRVINYIMNQEEHHRKVTFRDEYKEFLRENEIEFDEKYIFSDPQEPPVFTDL